MTKAFIIESLSIMYWIGGILFLVLGIPNATNFKERRYFSDERRLEEAMVLYNIDKVKDSVTIAPGPYYKRNKVGALFLGRKQRDLWTTPVRIKVLHYEEARGGLKPTEFGGGQQTIAIKLEDSQGRKWALRSVNKDQKSALPKAFRITFMRFLIRDQLASANPYGQLVVPVLANAVGVHHTTPELLLIPYDERYGKFNERMAGRVAYLEESLSSSWKNRQRFGSPKDILNTEEMMEMQTREKTPIDTILYLKTRLFDMLIGDWDRHNGNIEWALTISDKGKIFEPIPKDRDNAFYQFNEGLVGHITLAFVPKFQSFRKKFVKVSGFMHQSKVLDTKILSTIDQATFEATAKQVQQALTDEVITEAFKCYPPKIYEMVGKDHEEILKARLSQLQDVSKEFHRLVKENK
jgi:hypothetical protein